MNHYQQIQHLSLGSKILIPNKDKSYNSQKKVIKSYKKFIGYILILVIKPYLRQGILLLLQTVLCMEGQNQN